MPNPLMLAALDYESKGFSVIPLKPKDKIPLLLSWSEFQAKRANREQIGEWWRTWPSANIGVVTGAVSGLFVIDCDSPEAAKTLKPLLGSMDDVGISATGKGFHLYYAHGAVNYPNKAAIREHIDFRGDGGYVVAPPSIHSTGKPYQWAKGLNGKLRELPPEFVALMTADHSAAAVKARFDTAGAIAGLPEGQRDQGLFKLACKLRGADVPYETAIELCEQAAAICQPPFREARRKVDQAYKYSPGHGQEQPTQPSFWPEPLSAQQLLNLPSDPTRWVWDNCLPLRATSALIAKAYTGKSTFAASLALAISRGIDFLGRPTQQGNVLYVYLDGPIDELKENFTKIGLVGYDHIFVYAGRKPDLVIEWVTKQCAERAIKLLIIDTAQKFFGFKEDKYEEKINTMQPMLDLVDQHNFHAMFTYHAAKNSGNTISALGSVAVEANARVSLYLRCLGESKERIFDTEQNSGIKFETIGLSDPQDGLIRKTGTLYEIEIKLAGEKALPVITEFPGSTETEIAKTVGGSKRVLSIALRQLRENNQLERTGAGKRGSPFLYYIAGDLVKESKLDSKVIDLFGPKK